MVCALLKDFSKHGEKAIAELRRTRPAAYLKVLALLVPRKHKAAHNNSDIEPLEAMILYLEGGHRPARLAAMPS